MIVLHYTAMANIDQAVERLTSREHAVSSHYIVAANGHILQLVSEAERAWHAGAGEWRNHQDINSRSIGIEFDNDGNAPFPELQMLAGQDLIADIMERHGISRCNVIAHSDMAIGRKFDPGRRFDWRRLALNRLSVWPQSGQKMKTSIDRFLLFADRFGYSAASHVRFSDLLNAFRIRFRPWAEGDLSEDDMAVIADLSTRYPARAAGEGS